MYQKITDANVGVAPANWDDHYGLKPPAGTPLPQSPLQKLVQQTPVRPVLGTQVGGDHYTKQAIQPITYIWANGLGFSEGNVVKYVTRWKDKGGIKDLEKARHHIALLIEHAKEQEAKGVKYGLQSK